MGAYTSFCINDYEVFSDKNTVSNLIMSLFTEDMKEIYIDEVDGDYFKTYRYRINSLDFAKRLDIMGYTYKAAKVDFLNNYDENEYFELIEEEYKPNKAGFTYFYEKLEYVLQNNIYYWELGKISNFEENEIEEFEVLQYIFKEMQEFNESLMGIPLSNPLYLFRIIMEIFKYKGDVIYDVSDLLNSGYYSENYEFANIARLSNKVKQYTYGSIIVITEGNTDRLVLQNALKILYPNLIDLYTFFDYEASKAPGSTNEMVKVVKSFIATDIINKVIVIFDNDTAGHEAILELSKLCIPSNIKILTYPDIEFCKNYPTIGPNGLQLMDINGLASSIELYLGEKNLTVNDSLIPIQWTGYIEKMKKYQGKIMDKSNVFKKFMKTLKDKPSDIDWCNISIILEEIFNAFNN